MKRMIVLLLSLAIFCTLVPSAIADSWTCPDCGIENTGDYCGECGRYVHDSVEREITLVSSEDWFCLNCGNIGTSKFCTSCGSKRGEGLEGSFVRYGAYEQDDNINNGEEEIDWIVLEENDYSMTLLSLRLLDVQSFDASQATSRWSDSSLREWLNDFFLQKAFSETEQKYFVLQPFSLDEFDMVSLMPREMASVALIQREARIAEATDYAQNRAEGWISSNSWFILDDGSCAYVDGSKINQGTICVGGAKENMFVRPMIVIRNVPVMEELYQQGLLLLENEEYEESLKIFKDIRVYKDSAEKVSFLEGVILEERYLYGLVLLENEEYDEALKVFEDIRTYKDSAEKIHLIEELIAAEESYQNAIQLMESGVPANVNEAYHILKGLGDYKDAKKLLLIAAEESYQNSIQLMKSGVPANENEAYHFLKDLGDYKDAKNLLECFSYECMESGKTRYKYDRSGNLIEKNYSSSNYYYEYEDGHLVWEGSSKSDWYQTAYTYYPDGTLKSKTRGISRDSSGVSTKETVTYNENGYPETAEYVRDDKPNEKKTFSLSYTYSDNGSIAAFDWSFQDYGESKTLTETFDLRDYGGVADSIECVGVIDRIILTMTNADKTYAETYHLSYSTYSDSFSMVKDSEITTKYDESGKIVSETTFYPGSGLKIAVRYSYDDEGGLIEERSQDYVITYTNGYIYTPDAE